MIREDEDKSESVRERVDHSQSESARKCFNKQQIECDIEEMRMLVLKVMELGICKSLVLIIVL